MKILFQALKNTSTGDVIGNQYTIIFIVKKSMEKETLTRRELYDLVWSKNR